MRTLVRGVLLLSGEAHRQEVAENLEDAILRVRALATPATPSPSQMRAAFRELFKALDVLSLMPSSETSS